MEPTTVIRCVSTLIETFSEGSRHYTHWKSQRSRQNHYQLSRSSSQKGKGVACALATSFDVAGTQLKETYDIAFSIVGSDFSVGDTTCRDILCDQTFNLRSRVTHLRRAANSVHLTATLSISDILQVSESVRLSSVKALAGLYGRIAAGRPIPRDLPVPKPRSRQSSLLSRAHEIVISNIENGSNDDDMKKPLADCVEQSRLRSDPPSPPPTPPISKPIASDSASVFAPSTLAPSEAGGSSSGTFIFRPKVSVFSMFCPEAMMLQVDLTKPVPVTKKCKCGYRWKPLPNDNNGSIVLKEGFRMSSRFLAKSHSNKGVFGCILCVPSGITESYDSPALLAAHINSSHTKWQILHERDIT
ncbi:uncharacterized protein CTRU02_209280 [Colletotrichum truncatum]|uniref:Uncharacterized protein n=1 Tax=Colletotrichum truncatum TaxID=5467 RepID=A0ACC3YS15_COLTU|nr:uncharacterized protein CTRU02_08643 [Colletotrichum truncatum]KAF6789944.1 hypothetical protein CTRU02_08643 [Colletotrichum truncatum]